MGPNGAFKSGNVGAVTRRLAAHRVLTALPEHRSTTKAPKEPKTPRVVELLRTAHEWQALIESGEVRNQADIARREGITRARVTQIMAMLRLTPEIQEHILAMPEAVGRPAVSECAVRPIAHLADPKMQNRAFRDLLT